jgi:hypothetical protein
VIKPTLLLMLSAFTLAACGSGGGEPGHEPLEPEVIIGVPAGDNQLGFEALEEDAILELGTFSQGGTHVNLAIRAIALGRDCFVSVTVENLNTGAEIEQATPDSGPRPLLCRDENTCDLVPFYVMLGGLTEPDEDKEGLPVELTARVRNEAGDSARRKQTAFLSTRALPDDY